MVYSPKKNSIHPLRYAKKNAYQTMRYARHIRVVQVAIHRTARVHDLKHTGADTVIALLARRVFGSGLTDIDVAFVRSVFNSEMYVHRLFRRVVLTDATSVRMVVRALLKMPVWTHSSPLRARLMRTLLSNHPEADALRGLLLLRRQHS